MTQRNEYTGHLLVAGVAALVASSIVALGSLSSAQVSEEQKASCRTACEADTSIPQPKDCMMWCEDGDYRGPAPSSGEAATTGGQPATSTAGDARQWTGNPAPSDQCDWSSMPQDSHCMRWDCKDGSFSCGERRPEGSQQGGQQWGNQQGGMGCGSSPENPSGYGYHWACQNGSWIREADGQGGGQQGGPWQQGSGSQGDWQYQPQGQQQGPTQEQIAQALKQNGRGVCFFGSRWDGGGSPDSCAQQGGQWHGSYTQPSGQYHGAPGMGQGGGYNMGQGGGMQGGPGGMMGGPGGGFGGGHMSCDMFDDVIEEMKSRLTEMDEEMADRWSEMEEHMREKAADQIERLQDKIDDTDDEKKIAKYEKQIAKLEGKIEKQIAKMKARMEKQSSKMKARMEKEIAKLEDKAAECEEHEDEGGGDFGGGEFDGGGFGGGQMAPSFSPGGGNPFGF